MTNITLEQAMQWVSDHPDDDARIAAIRAQAAPRRRARDALDTELASIRDKLGPIP